METNETPKRCPCDWPGCPRHGNCKECQAYHHARGEQTCCEREGG